MARNSQIEAEARFTVLRQNLIDTGLNFVINESPYSAKILLKKSLVRDHVVGVVNTLEQAAQTGQEPVTQPLRHELEEARARILNLENTELYLVDRTRSSESNLGRAIARIQELEHAALDTSVRSQSLEEQLSKAREDLLAQTKQIGVSEEALGKQIGELKLEISNKVAQLKVKNKKIREIEAQSAQNLESNEKQRTEYNRKVSALVSKNSTIQARLDEAKKEIKLERSQIKSRRRKKEKAVQTSAVFNSLDTNNIDQLDTAESDSKNRDRNDKTGSECSPTNDRSAPGGPDEALSVVAAGTTMGQPSVASVDGMRKDTETETSADLKEITDKSETVEDLKEITDNPETLEDVKEKTDSKGKPDRLQKPELSTILDLETKMRDHPKQTSRELEKPNLGNIFKLQAVQGNSNVKASSPMIALTSNRLPESTKCSSHGNVQKGSKLQDGVTEGVVGEGEPCVDRIGSNRKDCVVEDGSDEWEDCSGVDTSDEDNGEGTEGMEALAPNPSAEPTLSHTCIPSSDALSKEQQWQQINAMFTCMNAEMFRMNNATEKLHLILTTDDS